MTIRIHHLKEKRHKVGPPAISSWNVSVCTHATKKLGAYWVQYWVDFPYFSLFFQVEDLSDLTKTVVNAGQKRPG
jgi:hypothetical protein